MTTTTTGSPDGIAADRPTLVRDGGRAVAGSVVSAACNVLVVLALARWLGAEAVGHYTIAFALRAILLLVCGLGTRTAMTRFVAAGLARGDHASVRGAVRAGLSVTTVVAVVVAAGWVLLAGPLARDAFDAPDLVVPMVLFAASLPFFVVTTAALAATQGFQTMRPYTRVGLLLEPVTRLGLTVAVLALGAGVTGAAAALLAASVLTTVAAIASLRGLLRGLSGRGRTTDWRDLVTFSAQSWVASMATQGLLWADTVILGVLVSGADVGSYQVAARIVLLSMLVITPLTAAMAPRISYAWEQRDVATVTDRYVGTVRWVSRLSFPLLAGVVAVPAALLHLFGSEFGPATAVVHLLAVGAVAEALGAPSAVVLNQVRHNRVNMVVNVGALALNVALNLVLVPRWGIEGAAVAWAVTLVVAAVIRIVLVRRLATSRWPFSTSLAVAAVAAAVACLLAAGAAAVVPDVAVLRVAVAGVVVGLVYPTVVVLRGLEGTERDRLSRLVALRLPGLRRWLTQRRLRGAVAGTEPLDLDALVSPFRFDVLARAELFALARERADLRADDPEAFHRLVRSSRYRAWFDTVVVGRGHVTGSPEDLERTFRAIVDAALQLLDRRAQHGAAGLGKVTVCRVPGGTELDGWRLTQDRWVLLDGGHRVALALLDGEDTLAPDAYVVEPGGLPPNNTARLLAAGVLDDDELAGFLKRGGAAAAVERTAPARFPAGAAR